MVAWLAIVAPQSLVEKNLKTNEVLKIRVGPAILYLIDFRFFFNFAPWCFLACFLTMVFPLTLTMVGLS